MGVCVGERVSMSMGLNVCVCIDVHVPVKLCANKGKGCRVEEAVFAGGRGPGKKGVGSFHSRKEAQKEGTNPPGGRVRRERTCMLAIA